MLPPWLAAILLGMRRTASILLVSCASCFDPEPVLEDPTEGAQSATSLSTSATSGTSETSSSSAGTSWGLTTSSTSGSGDAATGASTLAGTEGSETSDSSSAPGTSQGSTDASSTSTDDTGEDTVAAGCVEGIFDPEALPHVEATMVEGLGELFGVTAIDVDSDGYQDLVLGDAGSNPGVYVLFGYGDVTFSGENRLPENADFGAIDAGRVAAGPIADGTLDIVGHVVAIDTGDAMVRRWRGNGDGTFLDPQDYPVASDSDVALIDINGDGRLDLVGTSSQGPTVSLASAGETFGDAVSHGGIATQHAVQAADLDGDGYIDFVADADNGLQVVVGNASGFAQATVYPIEDLEAPVHDVAIADFNGDGHLDIAAAAGFIVSVRFGDGTGAFGSEYVKAIQGEANAAIAHDLNADGCSDIVVANESGSLSVLMALGNEELADQQVYSVPSRELTDVAVGDFDSDEIVDLITVDRSGGVWMMLSGG